MGRIKTQQVKRIGADLVRNNSGLFKTAFDDNKRLVSSLAGFPSKKLRNLVAGYVTRLTKKAAQS